MGKSKNKEFSSSLGTYKFIEFLGEGGSGCVYKCEREGKFYAIKTLSDRNLKDKKKIERFLKEIEFGEKASHSNIVKVVDRGKCCKEIFSVMPLYDETLKSIIEEDKVDILKNFTFIDQICEGLKFLHEKNVIHRDVKPENILLDEEKLVLADLGIAHFDDSNVTRSSELLANRKYAAPEQKIKGGTKNVGKPADIYPLGCIINELFTKEIPSGTNYIHIRDKYPWLHELDVLVEQCMRQNPDERPNIEEISVEIKLIKGQSNQDLEDIKERIKNDFPTNDVDLCERCISKIITQASKDISLGKYLFEKTSLKELREYNDHYNCDIHYTISDKLKRKLFSRLLYLECEKKFSYESNCYVESMKCTPLDPECEEDKERYTKFYNELTKKGLLDKKVLKLFSSCCGYHCDEIIEEISNIDKEITELEDAPIIYIVSKLKNYGISEVSIEDEIAINWEETKYDNTREVDKSLKEKPNNLSEIEILEKFRSEYKVIYKNTDSKWRVFFKSRKEYDEFENFVLGFEESHNFYKEDMSVLIKIKQEHDGVVELYLIDSFDITYTLAIILEMRPRPIPRD